MKTIFITGISTEVGKTIVASIVVEALQADYWKPIQSGDLEYSDTHKVRQWITNTKSQFFPNAYSLQTPASPHYSAQLDKVEIRVDRIHRPKTQNILVVEGAGGLLVPLNDTETMADLIAQEDYIILVSRHYLGSINHTLLTYEALKNRGFSKIGIIFSGSENRASEEIILAKTNMLKIGRMEEEPYFSPAVISSYASQWRPILDAFLSM